MSSRSVLCLGVIAAALMAPAAPAQWSGDPAQNLSVADRTSEQVVPKIAPTPDGGCWIGWFDLASGNYDVYLQRLDAQGVEQFPHNGLLVSDHPSNTWLVDWDLISDSAGHAVLAFADARDGSDFDIHAYRITPNGQFVWGPDGITLSSNADLEPAPVVVETTDGDFVVVWAQLPDAADGTLRLQRIAADGTLTHPAGGLVIASAPGEDPAFADVVAASDGAVIVSWVRDISTFLSPRHVRAQKFAADGSPQWGMAPVSVYDAASVPIAYLPVLRADGAGGAILAWHVSVANLFETRVQHLEPDGTERWTHNGVLVSTQPNQHKLDPSVAHLPATDDLVVVWEDRNPNQSLHGISAQKIDSEGTRAWGPGGIVLMPLDAVNKFSPRTLPWNGIAMVFLRDEPNGGFQGTRVLGRRLGADGSDLWPDPPRLVSTVLSSKSRLPVAISPGGMAMMVWEDDRGATVDLYAQNVNPDGTLGPAGVPGDIDGDGSVGTTDLLLLLAAWGPCPAPPDDCPADIDGDGFVGTTDLLILLANWG